MDKLKIKANFECYALSAICILNFILALNKTQNNHWNNHNPYLISMLKKIKASKPDKNWKVCSRNPQLCYYYTGLASKCYPLSNDKTEIYQFLQDFDLVLCDFTKVSDLQYLEPVLSDSSKHFLVLHWIPKDKPAVILFRIKKT